MHTALCMCAVCRSCFYRQHNNNKKTKTTFAHLSQTAHTRDAPLKLHPPHLSAHTTYAARCDSLECSTIMSVSSASGAAPSPPAERAATFLSAGSGALDKG